MTNMYAVIGINLLLCGIILTLGCVGYNKTKDKTSLYIGIAFGLFGISHLLSIVVSPATFVVILVLRFLAYLMVIFSLNK